MPDIENPLSEEQFTVIEQQLVEAAKAEAAIAKAKRAGIEVPGQLEELRKSMARLIKIKATYFPGR